MTKPADFGAGRTGPWTPAGAGVTVKWPEAP
jgi:hypothetical protein